MNSRADRTQTRGHSYTHKPCSPGKAWPSWRTKLTARSDRATEVSGKLHTPSLENKQAKKKKKY